MLGVYSGSNLRICLNLKWGTQIVLEDNIESYIILEMMLDSSQDHCSMELGFIRFYLSAITNLPVFGSLDYFN